MDTIFKEQIIKKKISKKVIFIRISLIFSYIIFSVLIFSMVVFGYMLNVVLLFGLYYLYTRFNIEYEYILTDGYFDIDAIINKRRRKRLVSLHLKDIELMTETDNNEQKNIFNNIEQILNYSSGVTKGTYSFIMNYNRKRTKFIIEPNDIMLKNIKSVIPPSKFII